MKSIVLVTRNARDKIQIVFADLVQTGNNFTIKRVTGQYKGKFTEQPERSIERGKVKRSVLQQAELEFNSIINKYLDKGYKNLSTLTNKKFENISEEELNGLVPSLKTDQAGNLKPMLAKDYNKCQNSVLQKPMYCSRKLDGVRCMIKRNSDGDLITVSRGGKDYNVAASEILEELEPLFEAFPDVVLDGEIYIHGKHLQEISGMARLKTWEDRCSKLEYWIYDLAMGGLKFTERLDLLNKMHDYIDGQKIRIIEHKETNSWAQMSKLHDKWVAEGYEGLVARKPDKFYEFGKRNSTMIKVKLYQDAEFKIIDYKEGLRDEDFCFICETKDGKPFAAKPVGTRELRAYYLDNIDEFIDKMATIKFFEMSKDNIPLQPIFKSIREDE